jgi:hypothetical protein
MVLLIPAICIMAVLALRKKFVVEPGFKHVLLIFIFSAVVAKAILMLIRPYFVLNAGYTGNLNLFTSMAAIALGGLAAAVLSYFFIIKEQVKVNLAKYALLFALIVLVVFAFQYRQVQDSTTNSIMMASKELNTLIGPAVIASREGTLLSLENRDKFIDCGLVKSGEGAFYVVDFISPVNEGSCSHLTKDMVLIKSWDTSQRDEIPSNDSLVMVKVGLWGPLKIELVGQ